VDVLVTYRDEHATEPVTFTVLQDAEVLAVGQKFQPDPEGKPVAATVVTLLLTPGDAERAVMASTQGSFHFLLRSGSDKVRVDDKPVSLSGISGASSASAPRSAPGLSRAPAAAIVVQRHIETPGVVVETIAGDKQTRDIFGGAK
jgi:pilus assembly protein CpaB